MADSFLIDNAMRSIQLSLNGLSARQQAIGRNIANVDTPGYLAQTVDFEKAVEQAMDQGQTIHLAATRPGHLAAPGRTTTFNVDDRPGGSLREDKNNVDMDVELLDMSETNIQYQALTQLMTKKFMLLKNITTAR